MVSFKCFNYLINNYLFFFFGHHDNFITLKNEDNIFKTFFVLLEKDGHFCKNSITYL